MIKLTDLLKDGFGKDRDFNCAEKILYGANEAYGLGLSQDSLKLAAGFGGGMGIEDTCGAVAASIMVLGRLFVEDVAHDSDIKELTSEFLHNYRDEMGDINCAPLKETHRTEELGCKLVIEKAAAILDDIVIRELTNRGSRTA